ncbi:ABC transporter substrate-binding protein [Tessaracoccus sp.]
MPFHPFTRRSLLGGTVVAATAATLTACAPGTEPGSLITASAPIDVKTDPASLGDVELVVWDQEVRGSQNDSLVALNKAFHDKYPNITIKRLSQATDDLKAQVTLALSGNDVPDVVQVNNARGDMGQFVKAGQLVDLSPYAAAYQWEERFSPSVLSKVRYSADSTTFGEGNLYGLPQTGEIVGIFYSAKKLEMIGGKTPETWDDYFSLLDKAMAAGEQPMVLGNIEKWPALHVYGPLQGYFVAADEVVKLGMGNAGASWTDEPNTAAMDKFQEWGDKKYLGTSPNGLDYDPAWTEFTKGTGVFLPGGSWLGTDMEATMKDDLHFMAPPPSKEGKLATTGGTGIPFSVPAKAKNIDAAAAYIDFITNDDAMQIIADNGGMPVLRTKELAPSSGVQKEIFEAFDDVSNNGTLLPYLDYATPSFSDTAGQGLQEVLGAQKTGAEVLTAFEDDYTKFTGA